MAKNYATTQGRTSACFFRCDYSYATNHKCMGCKFCYSKLPSNPKVKLRTCGLINIEKDYNKYLYSVPITLSRYCEPFLNDTFTKNSLYVMEHILDNGGQVIVKTSMTPPQKAVDLMLRYKENVQFQPKIAFFGGCYVSRILSECMAPERMPHSTYLHDAARYLAENGVPITYLFDPYVVGLNQYDLQTFIRSAEENYFPNSIIIKQLFATPRFKSYLSTTHARVANLLTEKVGEYYTYTNETLIRSLHDPLREVRNIKISMCGNRAINEILGVTMNCCQFENASAVYDRTKFLRDTRIVEGNTDVYLEQT